MDGSARPLSSREVTLELQSQIIELVGHLNAGTYRFLKLLAEYDRRGGWSCGNTQSCAHWLNWKCGINLGAAREQVRTAHALEKLPKISAAMARGELSYSKVRAITRAACPATEDYFLMIALHGTAQHTERLVKYYRRATEREELSREQLQQKNRSLTFWYDYDGSLIVKGSLPATVGALFVKALEAAAAQLEVEHVAAETRYSQSTFAARRADAVTLIAESFLKGRSGSAVELVVHVDERTLRERVAGRCELEGGPSLAAETARRLGCDASVIAVIEDGKKEPLSVGRKTRTIPPAIKRALNSRDRGCRFPGCPNKRYVDGHHVKHWADGGKTKLSNLVTLCHFHHRRVHEGNVKVMILDDGAVRFSQPNGESLEAPCPSPTDWTNLFAQNLDRGVAISKSAAATHWTGESMDYSMGVGALLAMRKRRDVSAETLEGKGA
jgi:hypothetical protein